MSGRFSLRRAAVAPPLMQAREDAIDVGQLPRRIPPRAELQILFHRQQLEDAAMLGHEAQTLRGNAMRRLSGNVLAPKAHLPTRRHHTGDRLERGRLARAIAAEQRHEFTLAHR